MKIAVCGQSLPHFNKELLKKSYEIGKEIANKGHTLRFGGCHGYPYEAAKGAFESNGKAIAVSPAKNNQEHIEKYKFPTDKISDFEFTGLGIPGRNVPLVAESDAVIIISGQIGTLNEFTLAYQQKKIIGVLEGSGGIAGIAKDIVRICRKAGEEDSVFYDAVPEELVIKLGGAQHQ